jgi:hypothetical protein
MCECSCEYVKYAVTHRRQDAVLQLGVFRTLISYCTNQSFETEFIRPAFPLRGITELQINYYYYCILGTLSQGPRPLGRWSAAARFLGMWLGIPQGSWMFVACECCMLSGRGLCDELIILPEDFYWLWWVVESDLETSRMRRPWPTGDSCAKNKNKQINKYQII